MKAGLPLTGSLNPKKTTDVIIYKLINTCSCYSVIYIPCPGIFSLAQQA